VPDAGVVRVTMREVLEVFGQKGMRDGNGDR